MRVLVVTHAANAFEPPADAELSAGLATAVISAGHRAEVVALPFPAKGDSLNDVAAVRMIDFSESCDLVVALSGISVLVRHPRKVAWLDRDDREELLSGFPALDDRVLAECRARFARSPRGMESYRRRLLQAALLPVPDDDAEWSSAAAAVTR